MMWARSGPDALVTNDTSAPSAPGPTTFRPPSSARGLRAEALHIYRSECDDAQMTQSETEILRMLRDIKDDLEYIKLRLSVEEVREQDLSPSEARDLKQALKELKEGKVVKLDEIHL